MKKVLPIAFQDVKAKFPELEEIVRDMLSLEIERRPKIE